jgi:hypothetical protein
MAWRKVREPGHATGVAPGHRGDVVPYLWMITASLKTRASESRLTCIPRPISNYQIALSSAPFARYFLNTIIVAVAVVTACRRWRDGVRFRFQSGATLSSSFIFRR